MIGRAYTACENLATAILKSSIRTTNRGPGLTWNNFRKIGRLKEKPEVVTSSAGGRHNMPPPLQVDLWPFDFESSVRVACDVGYLCANFSLPRPLCSRLTPDVRDRQTEKSDVRCASLLNAPCHRGGGIIIIYMRVCSVRQLTLAAVYIARY